MLLYDFIFLFLIVTLVVQPFKYETVSNLKNQ